MVALLPRGSDHERRTMALKLMIGAGYFMSLTGAGSGAWVLYGQASGQALLTENTWIPLGAAVVVLVAGIGVTAKAVRLWDGRDHRITKLEKKVDEILEIVQGDSDE